MKKKLSKNNGFTLVEMLIVVAIIAILVAVSIPLVSSSLDNARNRTDDANKRAAKAEGAIIYLMGDDDLELEPGTNFTLYYDAASGKLTNDVASITNYAQNQVDDTYKVLVTAEDGVVTAEWSDGKTTPNPEKKD